LPFINLYALGALYTRTGAPKGQAAISTVPLLAVVYISGITGNTYQVTCPVDTSHFATDVTLSVTQNLGARCSPAGTGTVAAVPTPRPTITVTAPEGSQTVCSSDTQAVFEYILTSADGSPISVTEVTPASCKANISTGAVAAAAAAAVGD
jgi:hypothetical protein